MKFWRSYNDGFDDSSFDVEVTEFSVTTAQSPAPDVEPVVPALLGLLRDKLGMDLAFVSGTLEGVTVARHEDSALPRARTTIVGDPQAWPRKLADALPARFASAAGLCRGDGDAVTVAIELPDGELYGALIWLDSQGRRQPSAMDLRHMRYAAAFIAEKIALLKPVAPERAPAPAWQLLPARRTYA